MSTFDALFITNLVLNALTIVMLAWAFHQPWAERYRFPGYVPMRINLKKYIRTVLTIGLLSLGLTLGIVYGLGRWLIAEEHNGFTLAAVQTLSMFLIYDFTYYVAHRIMHHPRLMPLVHREHHKARFPTALESLLQHPAELFTGLALLVLAMAVTTLITGPVSPYAFLAMFFLYSMGNIFIHSGLNLPGFLFAPINLITKKHYVHHKDFNYNYASMSPIPDLIFRTHRSFRDSAGAVPGLVGRENSSKRRGAVTAPLRTQA